MTPTTTGSATTGSAASQVDTSDPPLPDAPPARTKVLLVDDQPARLMTYEAVLTGLEVQCFRSLSAREALQLLLEHEFAVVLLDVQMPEIDGFELARMIREHPRLERTPIIFVTGVHVSELDRLRGYEVGAIDYIAVPVVPEILRSKVAVLVELHLKRRELKTLNRELQEMRARIEQEHRRTLAAKESELAAERLRSEAALSASARYNQALVQDAPVAIGHCKLDGLFEGVNKAFCELVGYSEEELRALHWQDITHPDDVDTDSGLARQVLDGVLPYYTTEKRFIRKDGSFVWVNLFGNFLRDETGRPIQGVAIAIDITEQRKSMQALRDSRESLLLAKTGARLGIFDWNLTTDTVNCDERLHQLWGIRSENGVGRASILEGIHPDDRESALSALDRSMDSMGDGRHSSVYRVVNQQDQSVRWVETSGKVSFEEGRAVRFNGIAQDITDRKDAEARLQLIADRLPLLISYVDADERYQSCNAVYCEWFGGSKESLIGRHIRSVIGEEAYQLRKPLIDRALRGEVVTSEGAIRHRTLGLRECEAVYLPHFHSLGKVLGFYVMAHDVTDRKQADERVRESELRFRNMADNSPVMIWVTEPDGTCSYLNRGWCEFTGQTPQVSPGYDWLTAVHEDDRARIEEEFLRCNAAHVPFRIEYRLRNANGHYHWVIDAATPRFSAEHTFAGYIGSVIDISERKAMEEALRQTARRKDEFLATLSHELRNPLAPIRSAIQLLQMQSPPDPRLDQARAIIGRQTQVMVRLVDDLLDLSRITRGHITLQSAPVRLEEILTSALDGSRAAIDASGHEVLVTPLREPIFIHGDATRLIQIFSNLLNNAAKYTPASGRIEVLVSLKGREAVIVIRDNGIGIPTEMLESIFDMFTQVSSNDRVHGGLGIGLTLARQLTEMHGGRLLAQSAGIGHGSEFVVTLPVTDNEVTSPSTDSAPTPTETRHRMLIADDNIDAAKTLSYLFELAGHDVTTAHDGEEALKGFLEGQPDIVILDIGMPGMTGHEVARAIRAQPSGKEVLLIAVSGWGQENDRRASSSAGFDHHLTKPVDFQTLSATLEGFRKTDPPARQA